MYDFRGQKFSSLKSLQVIHIDLQNDHGTTPMLHDYQNRNVVLIRRPRDLKDGEMDMTLFDLADFIVSMTSDP